MRKNYVIQTLGIEYFNGQNIKQHHFGDIIFLTLNEDHVMISFPLLLKHKSVFIFVLIHYWLLVHGPPLRVESKIF